MGLIFNGNGDVIKAVDGSLTVEGLDIGGSTNIEAGIGTFSGNLTVGGVLTYEDVKNVDSVGIVTAREGIFLPDTKELKLGNSAASPDLKLYSTGTNGWVYTPQSGADLYMGTNAGEVYIQTGSSGNDTAIKVNSGGAVELYNNNVKILETAVNRIIVTGNASESNAQFYTSDGNRRGTLGFTNSNSVTLYSGTSTKALEYASNALTLYHTGNAKLATTSTGVTVTGALNLTGASSGNYLNVGSSTAYANAAINIYRLGQGYADIRLSSNYGAKIAFAGASNNTDELYIQQDNTKAAYVWNEANKHITFGTNNTARMWLANNGNFRVVGISTFNSSVHVEGNLSVAENIVHTGDTDTKIEFATDTITFETAGTERLQIDSAGRLLVKESVNATGAYGQYATLQLKGNSTNTNAAIFLLANGKNTTANSSGDHLGYIIFGDKQAGEYAYIRGTIDASPAVGDYPGRIEFHTTADGAGSATERLRIDSTGRMTQNGTTSADTASALTLKNGQSGSDHTILELISDPNNYSMIYLGASDDRYKGQIRYKDNDHFMDLRTNGTDRLRITSAGKLLVGTTTEGSSGVDNLILYRNGNGGITIRNNANQNGNLYFSRGTSGTDEYKGYIQYQHAQDRMVFGTSNTERLRLTAGGQLIQYTTHTTGNSSHQTTSWYGDDASQYTIEIRDFNEMYAVKTVNTNNYNSIIYKREKMTNYCDIEFTMTGAHDSSGGSFMHVGMVINGDGSDTHSNFDRLVFRSHGGSTSSNHIRIDKGGGGTGFTYQTSNLPVFFDGNERHYQIKIRGRRFSIYIDGSHVVTRYTDANLVRTHGFFGINIYEASSVNPYIKIRDFKITNHTPNTGVPGWEVVFDTPASTNASSSFVIDNMDNPQTVEMRYWRLRHSGGDTNTYMRLGWQGSWKTSGYYDIGQYHNQTGNWNASRGHNQGQACPFHYDFTGSTNYYSGCITIRRVTSGGNNSGFIYKCEHVVDYDSGNTQYHVLVNGQVQFGNTNPWTKIQLYTNTGTNFNYGSMQVLAQY